MLMKPLLFPLCALFVLPCLGHASTPSEEAVEIIQRQYLVLGEVTGWDLSGNNIRTEAHQIAEAIKENPKKEGRIVSNLCSKVVEPEIVAKTKRLKELSATLTGLKALLEDQDYKVIIAYPSSLCGTQADIAGLSKELQDSIASVKGKFMPYFEEVQKKDFFEGRIGRYQEKAMEIMSGMIEDEPAPSEE